MVVRVLRENEYFKDDTKNSLRKKNENININ